MMSEKPLLLTYLTREPIIASEKPPLLLMLHGVRSNERDLIDLADGIDGRFFVASARGAITFAPGQYGWYPVTFTPEGPIADPEQAEVSRKALLQFIDQLIAVHHLDPERVYLIGFSQGAIMSLYVALTQPEKVAGAVIMSGRILPDAPQPYAPSRALTGLPILVVHGTHDTVLPIADGRAIRETLSHLPVAMTYHEYPMAHTVSAASFAEVTRWLTAQLDTPLAKHELPEKQEGESV